MRNRSGPITSTMWPIARNSRATVDSVRTTPFTWGVQASEMIRIGGRTAG